MQIVRFGTHELRPGTFELLRAGERLSLEPTPFRLLCTLIEQRERVVPRRELLDRVWPNAAASDASLERAVSAVRRALGDSRAQERFVRTVHGIGYRFVAACAVTETPPGDPQAARPPTEACA